MSTTLQPSQPRPPRFSVLRRAVLAAGVALAAGLPVVSAAQPQTLTIGLIPAEDSQAMIESSRQVLDALQQQRHRLDIAAVCRALSHDVA